MKSRPMQLASAWVCAIAISTTAAALPAPCAAQSNAERTRAANLFAKGQRLFDEGKYASAQAAFEEAHWALPDPVVLLSIAECQTRTEQFEAGIATLERYLSERPNAPDLERVRQQLIALRNTPAELQVISIPAGAELSIDGASSGKSTPDTLQMKPGTHLIAAYKPGHERVAQYVTLHIGSRNDALKFALKPAAPVVTQPPPAQPKGEPYSAHAPRLREAGPVVLGALGVAGVSFAGGLVLGARALKQKSVYDERPSQRGEDNGKRLAVLADVSLGIGVAASLTALVFWLVSDASVAAPRLTLTPAADTHSAGVVGSLRF